MRGNHPITLPCVCWSPCFLLSYQAQRLIKFFVPIKFYFTFRSFYLFFAYSWSSNYHIYWLNVYHFLCKCLPTLIPLYNPLWVVIWIPFNDMFPIGNILSVYPFEYVFSGGSCPLNSHSIIYNIPLPFIYAGESSNHPSMCLLIPMFSFIVPCPKVNQILCAYQILF